MEMCSCSFQCGRKGICCDCIRNHRAKGHLPACYFPSDEEVKGVRSIENFIELYNQRGAWWK